MNRIVYIALIFLVSLVFHTNEANACCHKSNESSVVKNFSCEIDQSKSCCFSSHEMQQGKEIKSCNCNKDGDCDGSCGGSQCCCNIVPVGFIASHEIALQLFDNQINIINFWKYQSPLSITIFSTIWQPPQVL